MERRLEEEDQWVFFPLLFESWVGCSTELSAWCDSVQGFWDRAIATCSALRSATHTSLMMETAHTLGISAGILFLDLQKLHDSVDLILLIKACKWA